MLHHIRLGEDGGIGRRQWSQGDDVSTEDLRICPQGYRAISSRMLPSASGFKS